MAKVTQPLPRSQLITGYKSVINNAGNKLKRTARLKNQKSPMNKKELAELRLKLERARISWQRLKLWKKYRWYLCAIKSYGSTVLNKSAKGYGAYTLYIQAYLKQNTLNGKQPISPCSARITDPLASPWDYTP
jgi:hypothetical protein